MSRKTLVPGCLVRADDLRPGDVFLTRGLSKESKWIAAFSRGEGHYAHAGIVIDQEHLFEADDDGVGATFLPGVSLATRGKSTCWVYIPYAKGDFVLFRHPQFAAAEPRQLAERLIAACKKYEGTPYAKWRYLLEASKTSGLLKKLLSWWLGFWDPRKADSPLEGIFCSQLVVKVFRELGLELFDGDAVDLTVSPNMLANVAELEPVFLTEVLDEAAARQRSSGISFAELSEESKKKRGMVKHLASFSDSIAMMKLMLQRQREDLDNRRRKMAESFETTCRQARQEMQQEFQLAVQLADRDHYDRVTRFRKRFEKLYPLAREYHGLADVSVRQQLYDAHYQLCLTLLRFQHYVTSRTMRAVRVQRSRATGLRGLVCRRSDKRRQLQLCRRLEQIRRALLWLPEHRKETEELFQEAAEAAAQPE